MKIIVFWFKLHWKGESVSSEYGIWAHNFASQAIADGVFMVTLKCSTSVANN